MPWPGKFYFPRFFISWRFSTQKKFYRMRQCRQLPLLKPFFPWSLRGSPGYMGKGSLIWKMISLPLDCSIFFPFFKIKSFYCVPILFLTLFKPPFCPVGSGICPPHFLFVISRLINHNTLNRKTGSDSALITHIALVAERDRTKRGRFYD